MQYNKRFDTKIQKVSTGGFNLDSIIGELKSGNIIAFPTETVYGIGSPISNNEGINKIFEIKGRSFKKPISAHIVDINQVKDLCIDIPDSFYLLANKFLPGPLTIILKKDPSIADIITAGTNSIGIRFPDNEIFKIIVDSLKEPLVATSANISGSTSPTTAQDVINELDEKISIIIDDGPTKYALDSTIISLTGDIPVILRKGVITTEEISDILDIFL